MFWTTAHDDDDEEPPIKISHPRFPSSEPPVVPVMDRMEPIAVIVNTLLLHDANLAPPS